MATIKNFEDLEIWKDARNLCNDIYSKCLLNPYFQTYDKSQIDRSSASIMDNIAEGFEREGNKEFIHFLTIAKGSSGDVRSQLIRALDRKYIDEKTFDFLQNQTLSLSKKLSGFINYLKNSNYKGNKFNRNNSENEI